MKILREIAIYNKQDDKFIDSIKINFDLFELFKIFKSDSSDKNFYMPHKITDEEYILLQKQIPEIKKYSIQRFDLFIESFTL